MNKDYIRLWFGWLSTQVSNIVGLPISTIYNRILGLVNWLLAVRDYLYAVIYNATSNAPWPISLILDWFRWILWDSLLAPAFDYVIAVARFPLQALDLIWDYSRNWWIPALQAADRVDNLRDFVLWVIGEIESITGAIRGVIDYSIGVLQDWISSQLVTLANTVNQLWGMVAAIQIPDLSPVWYAIQQVWGAIHAIKVPDLTDLWNTVGYLANVLNQLSFETEAFRRDPGGYVWDRLEPILLERIRLFLLSRW